MALFVHSYNWYIIYCSMNCITTFAYFKVKLIMYPFIVSVHTCTSCKFMISWDNEEIKIPECGSLNHFEKRETRFNETFE